jgi:hypothetical protein
MITKANAAFDFVEKRTELLKRKDDIKATAAAILRLRYNDGIFDVDREILSFLRMLIDMGRNTVVVIDSLGNPIEITDVKDFLDECFSRYFEATNMYRDEYKKIMDEIDTKSVINFEEFQ